MRWVLVLVAPEVLTTLMQMVTQRVNTKEAAGDRLGEEGGRRTS
jgi:hypothetical protein